MLSTRNNDDVIKQTIHKSNALIQVTVMLVQHFHHHKSLTCCALRFCAYVIRCNISYYRSAHLSFKHRWRTLIGSSAANRDTLTNHDKFSQKDRVMKRQIQMKIRICKDRIRD